LERRAYPEDIEIHLDAGYQVKMEIAMLEEDLDTLAQACPQLIDSPSVHSHVGSLGFQVVDP
jgi:hypothetical protein